MLEALGQLSEGQGTRACSAVLRRYAPMWLVQLPGLVSEAELERLQASLHGATPARMLRELAEALEVLTADAPLVLVLEDCSGVIAPRWRPWPTWRSGASPRGCWCWGRIARWRWCSRGIPLRGMVQELCGRGQAVELRLEFLTAEDVAAYVAGRLGGPVAAPSRRSSTRARRAMRCSW